MSADTLVIYYSMSGHTRSLAQAIAGALGAEFEEIREPRTRRGVIGTVRALLDLALNREPPVLAPRHPVQAARLLVLGGPIWAGHLAPPVRSFARRFIDPSQRVALFCTQGGRGAEEAFFELQQDMGWAHQPTLAIDWRRRPPALQRDDLRGFLHALRAPARSDRAVSMPAARA